MIHGSEDWQKYQVYCSTKIRQIMWNKFCCRELIFVVLWLNHATNLRLQWNIYTIYVHCRKMHNLFLRPLETGCKANLFQTFQTCLAMSTKEFADILCLSCNVKKSKTTVTLSENSWNKRRYNCFQWCSLWSQPLYCYRFFLSLYMNQVPEILY